MTKTPEIINVHDLDLVWVSSFYDIPLVGICRHEGVIHRFTVAYESGEVIELYRLPISEKIRWKIIQTLFEIFVGYHWTYKNRKRISRYGGRRPRWFWVLMGNFYYKVLKKWTYLSV